MVEEFELALLGCPPGERPRKRYNNLLRLKRAAVESGRTWVDLEDT